MNLDEETQKKIQELQMYEQGLHSLLMQKQAFQAELNESENALTEISKSKEDVFKIIGNIMLKADRKKLEEELKKRQKLIQLRLTSLDNQEKELTEQSEELRKEVMKKIK
jgi:prefoldin beta subunit